MHNYSPLGIHLLMYMPNSLHIHGTCAYLSVDMGNVHVHNGTKGRRLLAPALSHAAALGTDGLPECLINVKERPFSHNLKHAVVSCLSTCFLADMTGRGHIKLWIFFYTLYLEQDARCGGRRWMGGRAARRWGQHLMATWCSSPLIVSEGAGGTLAAVKEEQVTPLSGGDKTCWQGAAAGTPEVGTLNDPPRSGSGS